jgi:hypothetical protein
VKKPLRIQASAIFQIEHLMNLEPDEEVFCFEPVVWAVSESGHRLPIETSLWHAMGDPTKVEVVVRGAP